MKNKSNKRDKLLEKEIASLLRKYNIKQTIDILFPKMRWFFYTFFIVTVLNILAFIYLELTDTIWISSFSLIKSISILSIINVAVLTLSLLITKRIYLARKMFLLRLFISILTGWLLFFASEDFWKIEFDNTDSRYISIIVFVIVLVISFFMYIELKSLIQHKMIYGRVITVIGLALIISFNIGVFFMPDVLVGILDNSEFINNNKQYNNSVIIPLEEERMEMIKFNNRINFYKTNYEIILEQVSNLWQRSIKIKGLDIGENYVIEKDSNIKITQVNNKLDRIEERKDLSDLQLQQSKYLDGFIEVLDTLKANKKLIKYQDSLKMEANIKLLKNLREKAMKFQHKEKKTENQIKFFYNKIIVEVSQIVNDLQNKSANIIVEIEYHLLQRKNNAEMVRIWLASNHKDKKSILIKGTWIDEDNPKHYHPKLLIFQTFIAMFIGVFMQLLIQDKTVTESI